MADANCSKKKEVYVDLTNDEDFDINQGPDLSGDSDTDDSYGGFARNFDAPGQTSNNTPPNPDVRETNFNPPTGNTEKAMSELTEQDIRSMTFISETEADIWYNLYAKLMGFSIRKDNLIVNKAGIINARKWVCSKAGQRQQKHLDQQDRQYEARAITRCGCRATLRIKLKKDESEYVVVDFVKEHNHPLVAPACVPFLRSHRKVKSPDKAQVNSMRSVGIKPCKIMDYMVNQSGGYDNVGFTQKDLYNYVDVARRGEITNGDAEGALAYLCAMKDRDPAFFYKYDVDDEGCLSKLFWSDGRSQLDYARFGDVLVFDTTYRTNAYRKPFVILTGVNNHWQTTIFACALLHDEIVETYIWVLETFIELMNGKTPISVVTDGDRAMRNAIVQILPHARHRLCQWHIKRNAVSNIHIEGFAQRFHHIMTNPCSVEDFEIAWMTLLDDFQLHNNRWMLEMYEARSRWAEAYFIGHFFANIKTTQRCEGINSFIKYFLKSKMRLYEFVRMFDRGLQRLRHNEAKAHNESDQTTPVLITPLDSIERHAAEIFTRAIFFKVRHEIMESCKLFISDTVIGSNYTNYYMSEWSRPTLRFNVLYFPEGTHFACSCMLFEGMGIPCSHVIAVMKVVHMVKIPKTCIMERWLKTDNALVISSSSLMPEAETQRTRFGVLASDCNEMSYFASFTNEGWNEVRGTVARLKTRVKAMWRNCFTGQSTKTQHGVRDPKVTETKGSKPARNKKQPRKRCGHCRKAGHSKPTCPTLQPDLSTPSHGQTARKRSSSNATSYTYSPVYNTTPATNANASSSSQAFTNRGVSTASQSPTEFQFDLNSTDGVCMRQTSETVSNVNEVSMGNGWQFNNNPNFNW